jgi:hypothetical protein
MQNVCDMMAEHQAFPEGAKTERLRKGVAVGFYR